MFDPVLYVLGGLVALWMWARKRRRFRKEQIVNVTEGRTRVIRNGGGF